METVTYDPNNKVPLVIEPDTYDYRQPEDYVQDTEELLHIGQCYDNQGATVQQCKHCGGNQFIVATGSYFTAIKCPTCLYEVCIHDG